MPEEGDGQGDGQNTPSGGDEPFKSFDNKESFKEFESKTFSNGYNNYQEKALSRIGEVTGQEFESLDDVESHISGLHEKVSESIEDPTATTEYQELQDKYKQLKEEKENLAQENKSVKQQYNIDKEINNGLAKIKEAHSFDDRVSEKDVKDLFDKRYKTDTVNGKQIAKEFDKSINDWKPITDDNGNYKPLREVFAEFAKNYATPKGKGTGGGTSPTVGDGKVKRSDYQKAIENNDTEKASELFAQGEKNGWVEDREVPGLGV